MHVADAQTRVAKIFVGSKLAGKLKVPLGEVELIFHGMSDAPLENQAIRPRQVAQTDIEDFESQVESIVINAKSSKVDVIVFVFGSELRSLAKSVDLRLELARTAIGLGEQIIELSGFVPMRLEG